MSYSEAYSRVLAIEQNQYIAPLAFAGVLAIPTLATAVLLCPVEIVAGIGFLENAFMGGTSPGTLIEGFGFTLNFFGITKGVK